MSAAAWSALGAVVVAVVAGASSLLTGRLSQRTADKADAVAGFSALTDQLQEERAAMQATITSLREATERAQRTANDALATARQAAERVSDLIHEVEPIVTWIDAGAPPPPPAVSERLRSIIAKHRRGITST